MISITLKDIEYSIPASWNEVSVARFEALLVVIGNEKLYDTIIEYSLGIISSLTEIPLVILKSINNEEFEMLGELFTWSNKDVVSSDRKEFIINGVTYVPVSNYNGLTMGEAIDSELIIKDSTSVNLLSNLLPLLVRRAESVGKGRKTKLVPAPFDATQYAELKEELKNALMITDVIQLKGFF